MKKINTIYVVKNVYWDYDENLRERIDTIFATKEDAEKYVSDIDNKYQKEMALCFDKIKGLSQEPGSNEWYDAAKDIAEESLKDLVPGSISYLVIDCVDQFDPTETEGDREDAKERVLDFIMDAYPIREYGVFEY